MASAASQQLAESIAAVVQSWRSSALRAEIKVLGRADQLTAPTNTAAPIRLQFARAISQPALTCYGQLERHAVLAAGLLHHTGKKSAA